MWYHLIMEKPTKQTGWTLEKCKAEALKYPSHNQWSLGSKYSYKKASVKGWLGLCPAGKFDNYKLPKESGYWTYERCKEESSKYSSVSEWHKNSRGSVNSAKRNGWYGKLSLQYLKPVPVFTYDECKQVASLCGSFAEWSDKYPECYRYAVKSGWKDDICAFIQRPYKEVWTYEKCKETLSGFKFSKDWKEAFPKAYRAAKNNFWLKEFSETFKTQRKDYSLEECIQIASTMKSFTKWRNKDSFSYGAMEENGWYEQCLEVMDLSKKPKNYWTYERCKKEASKFTSVLEWRKLSASSIVAAHTNGWYHEISSNMERSDTSSDADVIYMWKAIGCFYNGEQVYKIGVTSSGVGDKRISQVMKSSGFDAEMIFMHNVGLRNAYKIETMLLKQGVNPKFSKFDGSTEFRAMSDHEVRIAKALVFGEGVRVSV